MRVLVSACLLGENCKYNGGNNYSEKLAAFLADKEVVPICPEVLAGLGVPRKPVEIVEGVVRDKDGISYDPQLRKAVRKALEQLREQRIDCCVLQSRSPTCGVKQVYDGTFSRTLVDGSGVLAQALIDAGYRVIDVEDI